VRGYASLLANRRFRLLWVGATLSEIGDAASWVALAWTVYELEASASAVGALLVVYSAPVVLGGPVAGVLLDRLDRRRLLIADNLVRACAMGAVPTLYALGALRLWHLFAAAAVYGLLKMFPLAGVPALLPDLVADDELDSANALESLGYWIGVIAGPAIAAVLLTNVDGPYVLAVDAATYIVFAIALLRLGPVGGGQQPGRAHVGLRPALAFILRTPVILVTTVMFMLVNVGEGIVVVLLPLYGAEVAGPGGYGALATAGAVGGLAGATLAGITATMVPRGRGIAASEALAGLVLLPLVLEPVLAAAVVAVALSSAFLGPLTVWAQTIRMQVIPAELRGRVFGTLRTAMQGTYPLGGALAPVLVGGGGVSLGFAGAAAIIGIPGLVGLVLPALVRVR
jgi:MFS family permease